MIYILVYLSLVRDASLDATINRSLSKQAVFSLSQPMARASRHDAVRRMAPEVRAVFVADEVDSVPPGRAEDKDGTMAEYRRF